jgi:hypothetical protein
MDLCPLAGNTRRNAKVIDGLTGRIAQIKHPRARGWRCLIEQGFGKRLQLFGFSLSVDFDFTAAVADPTGQLEALCQTIDERSVTHTLHSPGDAPA